MKKKPDYADKIAFQGSRTLIDALDFFMSNIVDITIYPKLYKRLNIFKIIKVSDAYKISPKLFDCKDYIKELGKRINYLLNTMEIDYTKVDFISKSDLYYDEDPTSRAHLRVYTKDNLYLLDCYRADEIVIRDLKNSDKINFKIEGNWGFDRNQKFKVTKTTDISSEKLCNNIIYKEFKNENNTIYKLFNDENKIEISANNNEIINENELISTIKNISLNGYNIEYIFKKIKENISLNKNKNTYLKITKYRDNKIIDEIVIEKGKIKIKKGLNKDTTYKLCGDVEGKLCSYEYNGDCQISYDEYGKDGILKKVEIKSIKPQDEIMEVSKKISDDINNQYQKILSYMKK